MIIRAWQESDNEQIVDIEKECFSTPWSVAMLDSLFSGCNFFGLVAVENDVVLGYVGSTFNDWDADVLKVAVRKQYRRNNVAFKLGNALIDHYCGRRAEKLFLEVRKSNLAAQSLYEKLGFEPISVRKKYYENTEDAIIMQKLLGE